MTFKLLAVDLGAESGRAILGAFDGERITLEEVHRFPNTTVPLPDGLHWDALNLWGEIRKALGQAAALTGGRLDGVGIDTWGVDFGLLDKHGALLGNPYHYRDARTDGMLELAFQHVPKAEIFAQTGIQFMQLNTLYQLLSMATRNSPQLAAAETFLTMPDLLNYWLTGHMACEFTNATTTQCYDTRRKAWAQPLLERLGIPTSIFPEVISPGTVLGALRGAVAEEVNLPELPVIAPACHDTASAVAAVPAGEENYAWISSGTWSIVGVNVREPVITAESLACDMTNEGGANQTVCLSKNIMGLWLVQESRRTWQRQDNAAISYDDLTRQAAAAQPLRSVVDPDHNDFLKPGDMPARVRAYCLRTHQPVPETRGAVVRCLLEGMALKYRWVLERLERLTGTRVETLHIVGGGTQNKLLSQLAADACQRRVITGPVEATATGNLLVQAVALGKIGSYDEAREVVRRSFDVQTFDPNPSVCPAWDEAFGKLEALMDENC
ncbi:MAG TPA: rhamnulokinase family protein [Anaerolineaceae bacterium]